MCGSSDRICGKAGEMITHNIFRHEGVVVDVSCVSRRVQMNTGEFRGEDACECQRFRQERRTRALARVVILALPEV